MDDKRTLNRREFTKMAMLGAGAAALSSLSPSAAWAAERELRMAHFMSPKHPIASSLMYPWADGVNGANIGMIVKKFPGGQIGGSPPGAFKRVVNGISDIEFVM